MITDNCIIIGKFGRPHGIKGYVTVHSFTEPRENILQYTNWHMLNQKQWQPLQLLDIEVTNKSILVMVKGYETRELCAHLTNIEIAEHLDVSIKTVEAQITKAFSILRSTLEEKVKNILFLLFGKKTNFRLN